MLIEEARDGAGKHFLCLCLSVSIYVCICLCVCYHGPKTGRQRVARKHLLVLIEEARDGAGASTWGESLIREGG